MSRLNSLPNRADALSLSFRFLLAVLIPRVRNVIVILADDLGYGDLGCYGHPKFKTPKLDAWPLAGTKLTQFNCPRRLRADAGIVDDRPVSARAAGGETRSDGGPQTDGCIFPESEITSRSSLSRPVCDRHRGQVHSVTRRSSGCRRIVASPSIWEFPTPMTCAGPTRRRR